MSARRVCILLQVLLPLCAWAAYSPIREYRGQNFFDRWTFFDQTDDHINNGDVQFLGRSAASQLAFVNSAGNAIVKVDNTSTVNFNFKRNSIRLEGTETYGIGSLIVIDVVHLPFGCSVWPAFWTRGTNGLWPAVGEIDIIEGVNQRTFNQMALHTSPGCVQPDGAVQSGTSMTKDCNTAQGATGCSVRENKAASYGPAFNSAGGGVFAAQFDVSGIFIWFFSRPDIPQNLRSATSTSSLDTTSWGTPSASWPSSASCNITNHFTAQQLVLDITLCGDFGNPTYNATCGPPKISCYQDNVVGNGSNYNDAYFEIPFIRVYNADPSASPTSLPSGAPASITASSQISSPATIPSATTPSVGNNTGNTANNRNAAVQNMQQTDLLLSLLVPACFLLAGHIL